MTDERDTGTAGYRIAVTAAALAALGGVVDGFVPRILPHHEHFLGVGAGLALPATAALVLLLLHALGAALAALGLACVALLRIWRRTGDTATGWVAVLALAVGEGVNAAAIFRVGSLLYLGPLACILAIAFGVWLGERAGSVATR